MADILINRVANSGLITLNLEEMYPTVEFAYFDIKDYLFMELILKEKDFRASLKEHNWEGYQDKTLLVYCSTDAIIPMWAYMLISANATPFANDIYTGNEEAYLTQFYHNFIGNMDVEKYRDKMVVIKGCSDKPVPAGAYQDLTMKLVPIAKSVMFGEPCSTVPIYKKKKN